MKSLKTQLGKEAYESLMNKANEKVRETSDTMNSKDHKVVLALAALHMQWIQEAHSKAVEIDNEVTESMANCRRLLNFKE